VTFYRIVFVEFYKNGDPETQLKRLSKNNRTYFFLAEGESTPAE
jgi:hypothetical protein